MKSIGEKLRTLRNLHHLKQEYLSDYLKIGQSSYSRLEGLNSEKITLKQLTKILELYNMTLSEFIEWDGSVGLNVKKIPKL